ncbi:asparagine synthase (glutamine-hydrolyzing) [Alkalicoccobacillus plakortidis]|uniref:asparagine synthase (glutamine-hydrolyzing) n=1 Tax=Alkalicoccobacillus plakortidis TaxID=444060 RepID=A0ABT0XGS4_9BACI|nr:asparagine synthase (glutamine-hydrolyzing) [Alkalicoccobacillus plakortidis]MCM2675084.1 asparagine synthase (glutamine-hydrolyzing) [Alkalicoccobacillus plakortidis]
MCGFIGEMISGNASFTDQEKWLEALEAIHHRGPDSTGTYMNNHVSFGFKRLSIIDLEHGKQPLSYQNKYHIIFNGEIYNYKELRARLVEAGYEFQTHTDTEVIVALYAQKGQACVNELRGMFGFMIWDEEKEELFCARDAFGIKPFYYLETKDRLIAASELKSLRVIDPQLDISDEAIQHYLTYQYVPEPMSLAKSVKKLEPGHMLTKKKGQPAVIKPYYAKSFNQGNESLSSYAKQTIDVLKDSVAKHMRSDVPVGAFLSSGIDSTTIVALAKEHNPALKTFTVGFDHEGFSEVDIARDSADKLNVENIHKHITPEEFIRELPKIIWHMDDPVADPAAVPLYFVAKEASKHVKVVLSGEGADELFGGYNIYREPQALRYFNSWPAQMKRAINKMAVGLPEGMRGRSYLLRGTTPIEERYIGNAKIFTELEKQILLEKYNDTYSFTNLTRGLYQKAISYPDSTKMQYIDLHTWLPGDILVKADRMTMAHSLELRVPFLDKEVFEVASRIPESAKLANGTTKYVLREAIKGVVPDSILNRKKLGFPVPIRHWLKDELYDWAKDILTINKAATTIFNQKEALALLEEHAAGKRDNSRKLWTIICFLIWHSLYIQNSGSSKRAIQEIAQLKRKTS